MTLALAFLLCLDGDTRIAGPPFLAFGAEAEFRAETTLQGVTPVWRIADAPGGALRAVETEPEFSSNDQSIRAVMSIRVRSVGAQEGDLRLTLTLEKGGRRVATVTHVVRIGETLKVPVRWRIVEHAKGGADPKRYRDAEFGAAINRIWKDCGIEFEFEMGKAVRGRNDWFDEDGRFHPVTKASGKREKTAACVELWKHDDPAHIDVFAVRDCHWVQKGKGLGAPVVDFTLTGIGVKEESALVDESAGPATVAHELGHVLGLDDLACEDLRAKERPASERRRLMFSVSKYRTATEFTAEEMKLARATALKLLKQQNAARK